MKLSSIVKLRNFELYLKMITTTLTSALYTCHWCGIYISNGVGGCCLSRWKALRRPDDRINKIQPSRFFLLIVMQRGKTWQELTVFRQLKQCRRMKKQKHTRMPFFAFHFTSGDYSGEIYTTGPPGIFRPQTAITVYFCQVSKYVIGAYNVWFLK